MNIHLHSKYRYTSSKPFLHVVSYLKESHLCFFSSCIFLHFYYLEEGADPESIEKVALQVLSIKLPVNKTTVDTMIMQIKGSLSNLTNINNIINDTSQHISQAKQLLEKAKEAK